MAPRIAVCGIHIESSTFTPYKSVAEDFTVTRGDALMRRYYWRDEEWAQKIEWIPILHAGALPGGVVDLVAYETWKSEILSALAEAGPIDGLFFDIHGAMSVEGYDDAEGDLIGAIREIIGTAPLVSASMDLHGNVSEKLFENCDLLTCYRMAPHEDQQESTRRGAFNLVECLLSGRGKPVKVLAHVPILLPGEKTSTRIEPAKGLYALVPESEARVEVLDAAIWIGFAWADQPRCQGAVVVTGWDTGVVAEEAQRLSGAFWAAREKFEFVAPVGSIEDCLRAAETGPSPYFISDSGDNPGAGGADDVTVALKALLEWNPATEKTVLYASIVDPAAAQECWRTGVGGKVRLEIGGHIDSRTPGPISAEATVQALVDDPRGGKTAAVNIGKVTCVITSNRNQYAQRSQYDLLGLSFADYDVVCVKIGYLEPDLFEAQKGWMMALTPGGVDQDLVRLGHHRIKRPLYPFDSNMTRRGNLLEVVVPE